MFLSINTWWSSLTTLEHIFWIIAIPFSAFFLIQFIMTIIGGFGDSDLDNMGSSDLDVDLDSGIEFQFISLKNFIAFFTIFGWTGIACLNVGLGSGLSIFIAIIAGLLMMLIMSTLFYFMGKLIESGNMNMESATGKSALVYLRIPGKREGIGKVQINIQGIRTLDAITDNEEDIKSGSLVKIIGVDNGNILVVELM